MALIGYKLSQINDLQEPLKDTDFFYYVTQSAGPVYDSKRGSFATLGQYIDQGVGEVLRSEFTAADAVLKTYTDGIVADEATARTAADQALSDRIDAEEAARIAAVQQEKDERIAAVSAEATARVSAISTEVTNRTNAITALTNSLSAEVTNRSAAITDVLDALTDEETSRIAADNSLTTLITNETAARTAAVSTVQTGLTSEISNRSTADATITANLTAETNARIAAITQEVTDRNAAITAAINTEVTNRNAAIATVAADVTALEDAMPLKADLVAGKIPASQLPSYVDDVVEVDGFVSLPGVGETGKIYVTKDDNLTYRWSGSSYIEISKSLALGETTTTAYRGDRGKIAYDHSQLVSGNPHGTTKADLGLGNVDNTTDLNKPISTATQTAINLKADTTALTAHSSATNNPHAVTKTQVGLANVDNTSDLDKPISTATQAALDLKVNKDVIQHTTAGDYLVTKSHFAITQTDSTIQNISIALGSVANSSGITITLEELANNSTDKLMTKTVRTLDFYKDNLGAVVMSTVDATVSVAGTNVIVSYTGVDAKTVKLLILSKVEVLTA